MDEMKVIYKNGQKHLNNYTFFNENSRIGAMKDCGEIIIPAIYLSLNMIYSKIMKKMIFFVENDDCKWAMFNETGKQITEFLYTEEELHILLKDETKEFEFRQLFENIEC